MVLISLVLLVFCCVQITKSLCLKLLDTRVQKMTVNRMAEFQMVQMPIESLCPEYTKGRNDWSDVSV
ncbi:hypothetical protein OJAV_G00013500 [Oryzias javanicus]|uniref:Uncharacterized protein n=1 Tax=Oryzias javanicus TaxID=123683 RepID=A0A3S2N6B9_ORYJA|nr:hypothetical protein OJAV_G00013500 [Oryzias javanicus]